MKKILMRVVLALLCAIICLGLFFSMALSCVYNQAHMTAAFESYAQETREDILVSDYGEIASEIIRYLSTGDAEDIPMLRDEVLFSEKENQHLKDCSNLTRGLGYFRFGAMFLLLLVFIWIMLEKDQAKRRVRIDETFKALAWGAGALLTVALALFIWGAADFESLFLAFHYVSFTNDLWILDPETDLLIQMMPYPFFVDYVGYILKTAAPALLLIFAAPIANLIIAYKNRKANKA